MGLIGKNEHGTTLSSAALGAVIESWAIYFNPEASQHAALPSGMMHLAHRVATALISDANKVIAIKDEALVDSLLAGLLVDEDNPRRGAEGCEELQEVCAGILSQLALFAPGAAALKSHGAACKTLKRLPALW